MAVNAGAVTGGEGSALEGVAVEIVTPGMVLHVGDWDRRGYYWDGFDWHSPYWWHDHRGRYWGTLNRQGFYWNGWHWVATLQPRHYYAPPPIHYSHRPARLITADSMATSIMANLTTTTMAGVVARANRRRIKTAIPAFRPGPRRLGFLCLLPGPRYTPKRGSERSSTRALLASASLFR